MDKEILDMLSERLSHLFSEITILDEVEIPEGIYDTERDQYKSDHFLEVVKDFSGDKVLGITDVDLYSGRLNFIFGQAEMSRKAAVISLARLKGERDLYHERAVKEAVHELGHTFGLEHCDNQRCVMHFSNSLADTDYKKEKYCRVCDRQRKKIILSHGV